MAKAKEDKFSLLNLNVHLINRFDLILTCAIKLTKLLGF